MVIHSDVTYSESYKLKVLVSYYIRLQHSPWAYAKRTLCFENPCWMESCWESCKVVGEKRRVEGSWCLSSERVHPEKRFFVSVLLLKSWNSFCCHLFLTFYRLLNHPN